MRSASSSRISARGGSLRIRATRRVKASRSMRAVSMCCSGAIRSNQKQSEAIRSNQKQSEAMRAVSIESGWGEGYGGG